ncbi:MAG: flagellar basal body-associated FliL family protein [Burkholderiaceae bacterium]|nr:flagellar basal body-associated FliL family protein [Burkholderiaceae bacterium]MEB2352478.1 flagellar basal body-associated FliL family protein [Burkholderiaceae bacterium]
MPDVDHSQDAPPRKRSGKGTLVVAALLTCAGAGAVAWFFLGQLDAVPAATSAEAPRARTNTVFVPLEQFTVNLADEGGERLAQIAVTLEVADAGAEQSIKARMPAIRNAILMQLSSLESKQLLTFAGKQQLAQRILVLTAHELGWQAPTAHVNAAPAMSADTAPTRGGPAAAMSPLAAVHFSQFIIQ